MCESNKNSPTSWHHTSLSDRGWRILLMPLLRLAVVSLLACLLTFLLVYLLVSVRACLLVCFVCCWWGFFYLLSCLFICLCACLLSCFFACLLACLCISLFFPWTRALYVKIYGCMRWNVTQIPFYKSVCSLFGHRPGAGIMEADDRQVTTVLTVQQSFHHGHSADLVSWSVTIVSERAVTPHLVVLRRWQRFVILGLSSADGGMTVGLWRLSSLDLHDTGPWLFTSSSKICMVRLKLCMFFCKYFCSALTEIAQTDNQTWQAKSRGCLKDIKPLETFPC